MKSSIRLARSLGLALVIGHLGGFTTAALAQTPAAATITKLTAVEVQQTGKPPTGPFPIVIEHDPGLATHTIYRPRELSLDKHGVLVWGEGGCAKNGLTFPEYLSEIASHGFVVIAGRPADRATSRRSTSGRGRTSARWRRTSAGWWRSSGRRWRSAGGPLHDGERCGSRRRHGLARSAK